MAIVKESITASKRIKDVARDYKARLILGSRRRAALVVRC
jgi:hypothetical protein